MCELVYEQSPANTSESSHKDKVAEPGLKGWLKDQWMGFLLPLYQPLNQAQQAKRVNLIMG